MTTAARRAARSAFSALRMSRRIGIPVTLSGTGRVGKSEACPPYPASAGQLVGTAHRSRACPTSALKMCRNRQQPISMSAPLPTLLHLLHVDPDGAAARQADLPGGIVGYAEFQHSGLAAFDHVDGLGHYGAFDAAARHRAEKIAILVDDEVGSDRPRRRAPRLHHGGKRNIAPFTPPVLRSLEDVFIAREHVAISGFSLCQREYRDGRAGGQW